jgi:hypothetical protein
MHRNFYPGDSASCEIEKGVTKFPVFEIFFITVFYCSSGSSWDYYCVCIITEEDCVCFSGHYFILLYVFIVFNTRNCVFIFCSFIL